MIHDYRRYIVDSAARAQPRIRVRVIRIRPNRIAVHAEYDIGNVIVRVGGIRNYRDPSACRVCCGCDCNDGRRVSCDVKHNGPRSGALIVAGPRHGGQSVCPLPWRHPCTGAGRAGKRSDVRSAIHVEHHLCDDIINIICVCSRCNGDICLPCCGAVGRRKDLDERRNVGSHVDLARFGARPGTLVIPCHSPDRYVGNIAGVPRTNPRSDGIRTVRDYADQIIGGQEGTGVKLN